MSTDGDPPDGASGGSSSNDDEFYFVSDAAKRVFETLVNDFITDYMAKKYVADKSGWRSLVEISRESRLSQSVLYGKNSTLGPSVSELLGRGVVESRIFPGERGRGGEIMRLRIAYDKEPIKELINRRIRQGKKLPESKNVPDPIRIDQQASLLGDDYQLGITSKKVELESDALEQSSKIDAISEAGLLSEEEKEITARIPSGIEALDKILHGGYPDRSTILVVGRPGVGKEALGYSFIKSGLMQRDFCIYTTRLSTREVLQDAKAFNIDFSQRVPLWFSSHGGEFRFATNDLTTYSSNIIDVLNQNSDRKIRIVIDALSSLLMLSGPDVVYKFLNQLFTDTKRYNCVVLATLEARMHPQNVLAAMYQLFDGILEMKLFEERLKVIPLLRIRKMRGLPPKAGYFNFSFSRNGIMEISPYVLK